MGRGADRATRIRVGEGGGEEEGQGYTCEVPGGSPAEVKSFSATCESRPEPGQVARGRIHYQHTDHDGALTCVFYLFYSFVLLFFFPLPSLSSRFYAWNGNHSVLKLFLTLLHLRPGESSADLHTSCEILCRECPRWYSLLA